MGNINDSLHNLFDPDLPDLIDDECQDQRCRKSEQ